MPKPERNLGGRRPLPGRAPDDVELRLAIGRAGIGLELAGPTTIGCLTVTELTATLPGVRFPVDVSGGVPRFRHRRGSLQTLQIEVRSRALEHWAAARLQGLVGTRVPEVWLGVRAGGMSVCVAEKTEPADERTPLRLDLAEGSTLDAAPLEHDRNRNDGPSAPIIAFDVDVAAEQGDLVFVVKRARGTDLPAPATAIAIACAEAVLRGLAKREGGMFIVRGGARALARALLPQAGARVPACAGVSWASIAAHTDMWILHAVRGEIAASPSDEAVRAREASALLRDGDDALVVGQKEKARALYLGVLERAPRHSEVARRILEIDASIPGRAEAALAMLAEARRPSGDRASPTLEANFGTTPGELLAKLGDVDAAIASFERTGEIEPAPALAARAFELAARLTLDADDASRWLDRAVARAPRSTTARWLRVSRRLELGRLDDALADVEHVEAAAHGRDKYLVWLRAGRAWQAAGLGGQAGVLFERALRYAPDEPQALAGLGAALISEGHEARGIATLSRAIDVAEACNATATATAPMLLELARAFAEQLDDLPSAIARVSAIPTDSREGPVARGLEGRWRAQLGDLAGAALAFARLREIATSLSAPGALDAVSAPTRTTVALLVEAADLQRSRLGDVFGAQRHLAAALRLHPHDVDLRKAYRDVGAIVARNSYSAHREPDPAAPSPVDGDTPSRLNVEPRAEEHTTSATEKPFAFDLAMADEAPIGDEEAQAAARVEELTRRVQGDPSDDAAADELASLLELLGRGHELLALLCGRLEDSTPERRALLAPRTRAALARLAVQAKAIGRLEEAALYREAMEALPAG